MYRAGRGPARGPSWPRTLGTPYLSPYRSRSLVTRRRNHICTHPKSGSKGHPGPGDPGPGWLYRQADVLDPVVYAILLGSNTSNVLSLLAWYDMTTAKPLTTCRPKVMPKNTPQLPMTLRLLYVAYVDPILNIPDNTSLMNHIFAMLSCDWLIARESPVRGSAR